MSNVLIPLVTVLDFENHPFYISVGNDSMTTDSLESQIVRYQNEFLEKVLGYQELFNLNNDNNGLFPITQKWIDFLDGVVYDKGSKKIDYKGIKEPLKNYIYYWYLKNNQQTTGSFGGMQMKVVNAKLKADEIKARNAWASMRKLVGYGCTDDIPTIWNYLEQHDFDAEMTEFKTLSI